MLSVYATYYSQIRFNSIQFRALLSLHYVPLYQTDSAGGQIVVFLWRRGQKRASRRAGASGPRKAHASAIQGASFGDGKAQESLELLFDFGNSHGVYDGID